MQSPDCRPLCGCERVHRANVRACISRSDDHLIAKRHHLTASGESQDKCGRSKTDQPLWALREGCLFTSLCQYLSWKLCGNFCSGGALFSQRYEREIALLQSRKSFRHKPRSSLSSWRKKSSAITHLLKLSKGKPEEYQDKEKRPVIQPYCIVLDLYQTINHSNVRTILMGNMLAQLFFSMH